MNDKRIFERGKQRAYAMWSAEMNTCTNTLASSSLSSNRDYGKLKRNYKKNKKLFSRYWHKIH